MLVSFDMNVFRLSQKSRWIARQASPFQVLYRSRLINLISKYTNIAFAEYTETALQLNSYTHLSVEMLFSL